MVLISRLIVGILMGVMGFFSLPAWAADETQSQSVPSLSERLEVDESELKPIPSAEIDYPAVDQSFWDLSSEPGAPVTLPVTPSGFGVSPSDLE